MQSYALLTSSGGWPSFDFLGFQHENGCPSFRGFRKLGTTNSDLMCTRHSPSSAIYRYTGGMPNRLHRYYGAGYSHFLTTSCYQRLPLLGSQKNRDLFLQILEQVRQRYRFAVVGYVVMPEHVHLLLTEPERGNPSVVMQALKQGFARRLLARLRRLERPRQLSLWSGPVERGRIWQPRFYDFVVFSEKKRVEKLRYMHRNPVKRGLVLEPEQWRWSSYRHYAYGEAGPVVVNEPQRAEMRLRKIS